VAVTAVGMEAVVAVTTKVAARVVAVAAEGPVRADF
jgi:hypothetical protein